MIMVMEFVHFILLIGIISTGFLAIMFKDLLSAIIALSAMSLLISLEFYILQAPDVAIAEASIGAGLTTAIFVIAMRKTVRKEKEEK